MWVSNLHIRLFLVLSYIILHPEDPNLQVRIHDLIHRITLSLTFYENSLFAIDETSLKELADVALNRIVGSTANTPLTSL